MGTASSPNVEGVGRYNFAACHPRVSGAAIKYTHMRSVDRAQKRSCGPPLFIFKPERKEDNRQSDLCFRDPKSEQENEEELTQIDKYIKGPLTKEEKRTRGKIICIYLAKSH
ncbi:hypothetical protein NDU88_003490 [Pleurodeles waltl]|uniref:Uncharacterized protein n=1 Tax=Pleurodeles waltl TaxID=8319 RepID=A0AAV7T5Y8_PLEWA|nr:hypothetical protein NDU88_003490 [Pleurodeles waltl]